MKNIIKIIPLKSITHNKKGQTPAHRTIHNINSQTTSHTTSTHNKNSHTTTHTTPKKKKKKTFIYNEIHLINENIFFI